VPPPAQPQLNNLRPASAPEGRPKTNKKTALKKATRAKTDRPTCVLFFICCVFLERFSPIAPIAKRQGEFKSTLKTNYEKTCRKLCTKKIEKINWVIKFCKGL
jgi:hypothetical protein